MFPHQIVAFQLKKNISSCEDELSILKKTNVAIKTVEDLKAFFLNIVPESKCLRGVESLPKSIMN